MLLGANGLRVTRASIVFPLVGTWRATLELDTADALSRSVTIEAASGCLSLKGTAFRSGEHAGKTVASVVGGAAGLAKTVDAKYYKAVPVKIPLTDLLSAGGEVLASSADSAIQNVFLNLWT